jgi:hypothetical protein
MFIKLDSKQDKILENLCFFPGFNYCDVKNNNNNCEINKIISNSSINELLSKIMINKKLSRKIKPTLNNKNSKKKVNKLKK